MTLDADGSRPWAERMRTTLESRVGASIGHHDAQVGLRVAIEAALSIRRYNLATNHVQIGAVLDGASERERFWIVYCLAALAADSAPQVADLEQLREVASASTWWPTERA